MSYIRINIRIICKLYKSKNIYYDDLYSCCGAHFADEALPVILT